MNDLSRFCLFVFTSLLILSGCARSIKGLGVYEGANDDGEQKTKLSKTVEFHYLGTGGYLIRYGDEHLMLAPSFTNPGFFVSGPFMPLKPSEERIDELLPPVEDVEMLLASHGHYDHLLDVPYIMQKHAPNSVVYGSNTVGHIMAAVMDKSRIVTLNDIVADGTTPGEWFYNKNRTIRVMAIKSMHAPHLWGIKLYGGSYDEDLERLPRTTSGWKEGLNLAFLIDFLDEEGSSVFRVHYEDSASEPPAGFIPDLAEEDQKRVDVAIMCVASFHEVNNYPEALIQDMQPKHMILGHWEDFFGNTKPGKKLKVVRLTNAKEFIHRVEKVMSEDSQWMLPKPFAKMSFTIDDKEQKRQINQ